MGDDGIISESVASLKSHKGPIMDTLTKGQVLLGFVAGGSLIYFACKSGKRRR